MHSIAQFQPRNRIGRPNSSLGWFAEQLAVRDIGLIIEVVVGIQLGGKRDDTVSMTLDSMQMAQVSTAPVSGFVSKSDLFSRTYPIRDTEHFKAVVSCSVGDAQQDAQATNRRILSARPERDPNEQSGFYRSGHHGRARGAASDCRWACVIPLQPQGTMPSDSGQRLCRRNSVPVAERTETIILMAPHARHLKAC